ncbi:peptidase domain-containing ABC transporter, partial [Proteus myxofaciens]
EKSIKSLEKAYHFKLKTKKAKNIFKKKLTQPIIFSDRDKNTFILLKNNENEYLVLNIKNKKTELINTSDFLNNLTDKYYTLSFKEHHYFDISWFFTVFKKYKSIFQSILFYTLILQILALFSPLVMQVIMDKVLVHNTLSTLDVLTIGLVFVAITEGLIKGGREYIYQHTANKIDMLLSLKLTQHLFKLPIHYFKARQTGAIVSRVRELDIIREFITKTLLMFIVDFSFIFVFIAVMAFLSLKLTLIFLATIPIYFIFAKLLSPKIEHAVQQLFQESAVNTAFLTESLGGIETIKSLSLEPRFTQQWNNQIHQLTNNNLKLQNIDNFSHYVVSFLQKVTIATILWIGAYEVISLSITIGQLIAFNMLLNHSLQPLGTAIDTWGKYIRAKTAVFNLQDILNLPKEQENSNLKIELKGEVNFQHVSFYYKEDMPPILNNISLHIKKEEVIGIVGASGSGKSTLARLIPKLYHANAGNITLDGIPILQFSPIELRQQIGFVSQENFLFNLSVFDNIRLTAPFASLEDVIYVAKLTGAHEFILKLPLGYDTIIAEGGSSLSGGQRQRIAIARTLLSNPKILIFDEATSALDDESQAIIQNNLPIIAKNKTVIIIAHRLSTIKNCHRIIVLEKGNIIEEGKHDELINSQGYYQKLWKIQQDS